MSESPKVNVSALPELIHKFNTDNTNLTYFCVCVWTQDRTKFIWKGKRTRIKQFFKRLIKWEKSNFE